MRNKGSGQRRSRTTVHGTPIDFVIRCHLFIERIRLQMTSRLNKLFRVAEKQWVLVKNKPQVFDSWKVGTFRELETWKKTGKRRTFSRARVDSRIERTNSRPVEWLGDCQGWWTGSRCLSHLHTRRKVREGTVEMTFGRLCVVLRGLSVRRDSIGVKDNRSVI